MQVTYIVHSLENQELRNPITLHIEQIETDFVATFEEAHISVTGESLTDAVNLIKSRIKSRYLFLIEQDADKLGDLVKKQLRTLQYHLKIEQ